LLRELTIMVGAKTGPVLWATPCTSGASDFSRTSVPHNATSSQPLHPGAAFFLPWRGYGGAVGSVQQTLSVEKHVSSTLLEGGAGHLPLLVSKMRGGDYLQIIEGVNERGGRWRLTILSTREEKLCSNEGCLLLLRFLLFL